MARALVFSVIALAPSLSESERKIALASDPALVEALDDYILLLGHPEWNLLERSDVTKRFAQSLCTSLEGLKARTNALTEILGPAEFSERINRRCPKFVRRACSNAGTKCAGRISAKGGMPYGVFQGCRNGLRFGLVIVRE